MDVRDKETSIRKLQKGFTLVEILFAVVILAMSLTTLLGLQASSTDQAIRTRNKQQAMLMARQILSAIELQGAALENASINAPAEEVLRRFIPPDEKGAKQRSGTLPMTADLSINFFEMKDLPPKSVKKVSLVVYWSDNPQDKISLVYFIAM